MCKFSEDWSSRGYPVLPGPHVVIAGAGKQFPAEAGKTRTVIPSIAPWEKFAQGVI